METQSLNRPAIGALTDPAGDRAVSGTAFAVSASYALTAFHCVGNVRTGAVTSPRVRIRFDAADHVDATVEDSDVATDLALLRLDEAPPPGWEPLPMVRVDSRMRDRGLWSRGFPVGRPFPDDAVPLIGRLADPFATIYGGIPSIAVASWQAATGLPMHGFSGAPVLVDLPTREFGFTSAVIGVIRWMPIDQEHPDAAAGGLIYAAPVSSAERWDSVAGSFVQPSSAVPARETSVRNFVLQYLGDGTKPVPFGGREDDLAVLDGWLNDPDAPPRMLVTASAGLGKSALLVRWSQRLARTATVFVPVTIRWQLNARQEIFEALASRLAYAHGDWLGDVGNPAEAVSEYLRRPAGRDRKLVVVVDGLDEANGWDASPALFPVELGAGVRVVASARLTADRATAEAWLEALGWSARAATHRLTPLTRDGVRHATASMGERLAGVAAAPSAVAALHASSGGDPLVLALCLGDLWEHGTDQTAAIEASLTAQPPGLAGYLDRWFREQEELWSVRFGRQDPSVRAVFNLLCCALGPLHRKELLRLSRPLADLDTDTLSEALGVLRRLVVRDPVTDRYAVTHPRLAAHRRALLAGDGVLERYQGEFLNWGRQTMAALLADELPAEAVPEYLIRNYGAHLESADAPASDVVTLAGPRWRDAWDVIADSHDGRERDIGRARARLAQANRHDVAAGRPPQLLGAHLRVVAAAAQARTSSELVTPRLAAELVRFGRWPASRALALVREIPTAGNRVYGLAAVAPALPAETLPAAVELLSDLQHTDHYGFGPAFAAIVDALCRHGQVNRARRLVQEQPPGYPRGLGVLRLWRLDPDGCRPLAARLLTDLAEAQIPWGDFLTEITATIDRQTANDLFGGDGPPPDFAARAAYAATGTADKPAVWAARGSQELAPLLPWLDEPQRTAWLQGMVGRFGPDDNAFTYARAAWAGAPWFDEALTSRVLRIALEELPYPESKVRVLTALLARLPEHDRRSAAQHIAALLGEVLPRISPKREVEQFVGTLVRQGFADTVLGAIAESSGEWWIHQSLEALAPFLTREQTDPALETASMLRRETRAEGQAAVLARLASFSGNDAARAVGLARRLGLDSDELAAARAVARVATGAGSIQEITHTVADDRLRYAALASAGTLLNGLEGFTGADLLAACDSFSASIHPHQWLQPAVFDLLLDYLPDAELDETETLMAAMEVIFRGIHQRKAQILIKFFARLAAAGESDAAIRFARARCTSTFTFPLMCAVAGVAVGSPEPDVSHLLEVAREVEPGIEAATARAALMSRLPDDLSDELWPMVVGGLSGSAHSLPRHVAVAVELLPLRLRRPTLDRLFPIGYLRREPDASWFHWDDGIADLVPVLERDQLEPLRYAADQVGSGTTRGRIRAAVAARLAVLGDLAEAFAVVERTGHDYQASAVEKMLAAVADPAVPEVLRRVPGAAPMPNWRDARAIISAAAAPRISKLPPAVQWQILDEWLERPLDVSTLMVDLLGLLPALRLAGGAGDVRDLLDELVS